MKLMARRNSMITSIGKSRWNMSVCITVLKNSIVFLFFFFLLVLVSSCRRSSTINTPNGEYKMIDCQEINGGKFKLSSIASSFSVIPLETNDSCLIGGISKLEFYDGKIFVLDKMHSARLYVFDTQGEYKFAIGKRGSGPNEYMQINDFSIDKEKNLIYVLCDKKKLFTYSLSGQPLGTITLDFFADAMEYQKNQLHFVCDRLDRGNLIVTDIKGRILYEDFPNKRMGDNLLMLIHPFSKQDSILLYRIYLDNKIYEMQSDHRIKVAYEVNFGEESIDFEDLEDIPHREVKKKLANSRGKIKYLTENRNYIQLIFFDKQMPCVAVYDKRQGVTRSYTFENCVNDLTGLQYPLFEFTKGQDEFIAILSPMDIENAGSELTEKGKAVFKDVNFVDDDNPILYIVKTE